jgi:hypothetical protein
LFTTGLRPMPPGFRVSAIMHKVVSVDLAYRTYRDSGIAVLQIAHGRIECAFVDASGAGLRGEPAPDMLAEFLVQLAAETRATVLMIDGPQAWKDPQNGCTHCRLAERELHTPAKTGEPGTVKPANYLPFVAFAVALFDELSDRHWPRFDGLPHPDGTPVAVESFPMSAWKSLGLRPLPAKAKSRPVDLQTGITALQQRFPLAPLQAPNHDELQALVAGLAGIGLLAPDVAGVEARGVAPFLRDGVWREGFIVNPTLPSVQG